MSRLVPAPPRPFSPAFETWPRGRTLFRVHSSRRRPGEFNPGVGEPTRFAFFGEPVVPVLYAGGSAEAAVAESLLHDVGMSDGLITHETYRGRLLSAVTPARDLRLVQLHSGGLLKLRVEPAQLTATSAAHYPDTVAWAAAAHACDPRADGLVWMSWRWNSQPAVILFGDRVDEGDLEAPDHVVHRFDTQGSFAWLARLCHELDVDVQPPPSADWAASLLALLRDA